MPRPATCSEDELERCVATLAYIVVRHGPVYAPLFDRMERELAEMRRRGDPTDRARRYLEAHTIDAASLAPPGTRPARARLTRSPAA